MKSSFIVIQTQATAPRRVTPRGKLALRIAVTLSSFAVALAAYVGLGISPASSFPYALSVAVHFLTLTTWTCLFQGTLVFTLMILRRRFVPSYLFSFVVGSVFGNLPDKKFDFVSVLSPKEKAL